MQIYRNRLSDKTSRVVQTAKANAFDTIGASDARAVYEAAAESPA